MTSIQHHLTDDLIFAYSAGMLPEAVNLIVASHVSMCDMCRAAVETYDTLGGSVLENTDEVEVSDACLDNALALIRGTPPETRPIRRQVAKDGRVPQPLQDYIGGSLDDVAWRPLGMGVKQVILPTSQDATARLLYIPAGMAMPDHGHKGMELTLVLQGAFSDADGCYARGDIEVVDAEVDHTPVADPSEDCICLAVTDAPLRFTSLLPRLAQPFFRI
jgi:putative transcriptional regulator